MSYNHTTRCWAGFNNIQIYGTDSMCHLCVVVNIVHDNFVFYITSLSFSVFVFQLYAQSQKSTVPCQFSPLVPKCIIICRLIVNFLFSHCTQHTVFLGVYRYLGILCIFSKRFHFGFSIPFIFPPQQIINMVFHTGIIKYRIVLLC